MAKVIAPFKIVGTLNDLTFYLDQQNNNLVKTKGNPGITREQFLTNPIFTKVRNHSIEFGSCTKKAQSFRSTALQFFKRAKDGSFAGRANKLMLEILKEDTTNPNGSRSVEKGMENPDSAEYFIGFEGNKMRPLHKILKTKYIWNEETNQFTIKSFNPKKHIDWPEKADNIHIATAYTIWNFNQKKFETHYSQEIIINKEEDIQNIALTIEKKELSKILDPEHTIELAYCFIGFSIQERKKTKELKRAFNTLTIIHSK